MKEFFTNNDEETMEFAEKLGELLQPNQVVTLDGDLGAGKTTFTKGLAKGLGVERTVNSPTYTIVKEYRGRMPLYHMDVYRLEDSEEDIGFDEYFSGEGITVIEWSDYIRTYLPERYLKIQMKKISADERQILLQPIGEEYEKLIEELQQ
ncbi:MULTISPECIES: tRNA (adenosine(37)-N6)-threonylcarbamoyltransferase complex ATPase subunit type 1 TsaE [Allobacillus]|uniref:tRNA threonylcarbamoyladenosine biosynthesis protein TsaE n=1 Tax=Allobacillus salarius TaxID=1955272 RepID=A0A556PGQ2_9BACI|nr:tRNA (adenosine(37)-N6)-threonylcarbamoyltransferase complex ATPase subunit type 1 TsaE [Allobacillus salarius]TSJ63558.1 tRNA (adenosine(37)-N6)-threonylcarbamoyltransferase complex ATPase subunit type 1 TsaE [Allobacillus salarius]